MKLFGYFILHLEYQVYYKSLIIMGEETLEQAENRQN